MDNTSIVPQVSLKRYVRTFPLKLQVPLSTMKSASSLLAIAFSITASNAFQASRVGHDITARSSISGGLAQKVRRTPSSASLLATEEDMTSDASPFLKGIHSSITAAAAAAALFLATAPVNAVSGGGLDYAGLDISNQDFSNGNYKGKDFTQVLAKATTFANSNLQGCRFYKAYLVSCVFCCFVRIYYCDCLQAFSFITSSHYFCFYLTKSAPAKTVGQHQL